MIVIIGATGHAGKAAAKALLAKGEKIRVVARDQAKLQPFQARGAETVSGNVENADSMAAVFQNAEAAYLVVPPDEGDAVRAYQERVTDAYAAAIKTSKIPSVVTLSSLGAQHPEKTGPIVGLHNMEQKLNAIPGLHVLHLRAASFMENFLRTIQPLRSMGALPGAAPADHAAPLIATRDIGAYAAKRLAARDFSGSSVQELVGPRDYTMTEAATILGTAVGKPGLRYMQVPLMMLEGALVQMGIPKSTAALMIEMFKAENSGMCAPLQPRSSESTTPTTLETFAAEIFAPAYLGKTASA